MKTSLAQPATQDPKPNPAKLAKLDEKRERDSILVDESESLEGRDG